MNANAIGIISIGNRAWISEVLDLAEGYAKKCSADLVVFEKNPDYSELPLPELPDNPGRPNKLAYASKTFFAWKMLEQRNYQKVLIIDDTCCINLTAPNIFEKSVKNSVVYTTTGTADAEKSFQDIAKFIENKKINNIEYDTQLYMNSGVLVYDAGVKDAISPLRIVAAQDLLFSRFPHQSLTYYLLRSANIKMVSVDRKFNHVPGVSLEKEKRRDLVDILPYLKKDVYIYHVTGMYRNRDVLIKQIYQELKK